MRIKVFTNCPNPGIYKGVEYFDLVDFFIFKHFNTIQRFLSVRSIKPFRLDVNAKQKMLWIHDNPNVNLTDVEAKIDRIISVSDWQKQQWAQEYKFPSEKIYVTRNGVDIDLFADNGITREQRLIYTSQPQRGLEPLLQMFPKIREQCPGTSLHVFYYSSEDVEKNLEKIRRNKDLSGVEWHGSVNKKTLAQELMKARVWVYPTTCYENSCIAAIEAQAAGTPVVCSKLGALPTTVVNCETGWLIEGNPDSPQYQNQFIQKTVALLKDQTAWSKMSDQCRKRAQAHFNWQHIADEWMQDLL